MPHSGARPFAIFPSVLVTLLTAGPCWAAGPWIADAGGADMGLAGAGRAALALDAGSLAANPAAAGALPDASVTAAAVMLDLEYEFEGSVGVPVEATNQEGITVLPAAFAVGRAGRLSYGVGAYSYFGLSFDSGAEWGGRRVAERAGVATYNVGPTVAWTIDDRLIVGASVLAQWARPEFRLAVANDALFYGPPAGLQDGQLTLSGDDWAAAVQLGVLIQPRPGLRLGVSWTAPADHSVALDVEAQNVHPILEALLPADGAARLDFTLPQQLMLGVSRDSGHGTLVCAGLNWQDWSALGGAQQKLPGQTTPIFADGLQDTWGASIGVRQDLDGSWAASLGIDYQGSPAPDAGVPAYFPAAEQWKVAAGVEHLVADRARVRGTVSVIVQGEADVVQATHPIPLPGIPQLTGTYDDTRVYVVSLAADFRL